MKKPDRILPPVSSKSLANKASPVKSQTFFSERLEDLKIAIAGERTETMVYFPFYVFDSGPMLDLCSLMSLSFITIVIIF